MQLFEKINEEHHWAHDGERSSSLVYTHGDAQKSIHTLTPFSFLLVPVSPSFLLSRSLSSALFLSLSRIFSVQVYTVYSPLLTGETLFGLYYSNEFGRRRGTREREIDKEIHSSSYIYVGLMKKRVWS